MTGTWTRDELARIATADELRVAPRRADGTLRDPVTVWVVRQDDDLYVRSYRGVDGRWWRGAEASHEGHIRAGGVDRDVVFEDTGDRVDRQLNDRIDRAYRTKYGHYPAQYVTPMLETDARATTLRLVPR